MTVTLPLGIVQAAGGGLASNVNTDYFTEVAALDNLALFYKFDEASGTMSDSSGNAVHLDNPTTAPTYGGPRLIPSQIERSIICSTSVSVASTLAVPAALVGDNDWTAVFWLKSFYSAGSGEFFKISSTVTVAYGGLWTSTGRTIGVTKPGSGVQTFLVGGDTSQHYAVNPGACMFACVRDAAADTVKGYMNGVLIQTKTSQTAAAETASIATLEGRGNSLQGLAYFTDQLTPTEILQLYYAGVSGNINGPA